MVYTTSGASADVSGGGVRLNMIPRDGGNTFAGSVFGGYQTKGFQTDNLTDELKARGLRSTDGIDKLYNMEASLGGPIKKDKIWFFMSARTFHLDTLPADVFLASGPATATAAPPRGTEPGVDPQKIDSAQLRLTWQITPKHKFAFYNDRLGKDRGAAMTAGFDPATRVDRVGLADLHDRVGQDHLHAEQQAPVRRRRLVQLRALQQPVPGRHREGPRHARVVHDHSQGRHGPGHDVERRHDADRHVPGSLCRDDGDVLHHRRAQHQGRRAGYVGPVPRASAAPTATCARTSRTGARSRP